MTKAQRTGDILGEIIIIIIIIIMRPLGRPRRRWLDNIKMDLREIGRDGLD
jgi:hypothetical protein